MTSEAFVQWLLYPGTWALMIIMWLFLGAWMKVRFSAKIKDSVSTAALEIMLRNNEYTAVPMYFKEHETWALGVAFRHGVIPESSARAILTNALNCDINELVIGQRSGYFYGLRKSEMKPEKSASATHSA